MFSGVLPSELGGEGEQLPGCSAAPPVLDPAPVCLDSSPSQMCLWARALSYLTDVPQAADHKCDGSQPGGHYRQLVSPRPEAVPEPPGDPLQVSG